MDIRDVAVIGAGPAGIAAAIQLKRCGIDPLLLEQGEVGGLLWNAYLVENYPGFPEGISGPDLVRLFRRHLDHAGVEVGFEGVEELEFSDGVFTLRTGEGVIGSRIVIVASGTKQKSASGVRISEGAACRIYYEAKRIAGVRGKKIVIVGAGDAAFDYALNMSRHNDVVILSRGDRVRCIPPLRERCERAPGISCLSNAGIEEMDSNGERVLIRFSSGGGQGRDPIEADYVLFAIGREPRLDFLGEGVKADLDSLIRQKVLYLAGDVKNGSCRQTVIAAGDGVMAAMRIQMEMRI